MSLPKWSSNYDRALVLPHKLTYRLQTELVLVLVTIHTHLSNPSTAAAGCPMFGRTAKKKNSTFPRRLEQSTIRLLLFIYFSPMLVCFNESLVRASSSLLGDTLDNTGVSMNAIVDGVLNLTLHWGHGKQILQDVAYVPSLDDETVVPMSSTAALEAAYKMPDSAYRIVCISDTHDAHRLLSIPRADVLIHAGDVQMTSRVFSRKDCERKLMDFNQWLGELPVTHKIVIGGNHDTFLEKIGKKAAKAMLSNATDYLVFEDIVLSHPRCSTAAPLHIYGAPFSEGHSANAAYQLRNDPRTVLQSSTKRRVPPQLVPAFAAAQAMDAGALRLTPLYDVCVSHSPYLSALSLDKKLDASPVSRMQLGRVHVGGHLHGHYGVRRYQKADALCIVACSLNGRYEPKNPPIVFDYTPQECVASTHMRHAPHPTTD